MHHHLGNVLAATCALTMTSTLWAAPAPGATAPAPGNTSGDGSFFTLPAAAPAIDLTQGGPAAEFAKGSWVTPAYFSATVGDNDHLYEAHAGVGYFFMDNLALNAEVVGSYANYNSYPNDPANAWGAGLDLLFRWHFIKGTNWSLYADGGGGLREFSRAFPTGGTHFNFTPQIGLGATYKLADNLQLMGGARYFHLSNAGFDGNNHNPGYDALQLYLGATLKW